MKDKIPTNKGDLSIPEIMDELMFQSYKVNRDNGVCHEALVDWRIGNEAMKIRYDNLKNKQNEKIKSAN